MVDIAIVGITIYVRTWIKPVKLSRTGVIND